MPLLKKFFGLFYKQLPDGVCSCYFHVEKDTFQVTKHAIVFEPAELDGMFMKI